MLVVEVAETNGGIGTEKEGVDMVVQRDIEMLKELMDIGRNITGMLSNVQ